MSEINYPLQRALDSQQAARAFAAQALNSLFLVNGGALVTLLALAGAYAGGGSAVPQGLTAGGYPFAIGLSLAVGSAVVAYATQFSLSSYRESQAGDAPSYSVEENLPRVRHFHPRADDRQSGLCHARFPHGRCRL
ncbi:hypothetical protein [Brevundimonas sp.]|uniref:hypothetical protein n=1 Tax=Brevundimonas sp. TaxID=1871086 RepID=UPI003A92BC60